MRSRHARKHRRLSVGLGDDLTELELTEAVHTLETWRTLNKRLRHLSLAQVEWMLEEEMASKRRKTVLRRLAQRLGKLHAIRISNGNLLSLR